MRRPVTTDPADEAPRSCGGCRVCCTTPSIDDGVVKPAWSPCPHECETGCAIYATRPKTCADYRCLWLKGELPEWAYPPRTGLMVSRDDPSVAAINVIEATRGAASSYWGERLVKFLGRKVLVHITKPGGTVVTVSTARARREFARGESWRR